MNNPALHAALLAWLRNHASDPHPEPERYADQVLFLPEVGQIEAGQ
jgi:hypothetical protein